MYEQKVTYGSDRHVRANSNYFGTSTKTSGFTSADFKLSIASDLVKHNGILQQRVRTLVRCHDEYKYLPKETLLRTHIGGFELER